MESGDWKAQLQRARIVDKIIDTLKSHLLLSGHERLQELKNIAERVEHEIYTAATTQSEYARKICLNILLMETRLQNAMRSNSPTNTVKDLTAQTCQIDGGGWQEEIYQKIIALKDQYLLELKDLYLLDLRPTRCSSGADGDITMESGGWRAQLKPDSREKIKNRILYTLTRHLPYSGYKELQEVKKIAERVEEEIYTGVTNLSEYARLLCLIILTMETRLRNFMSDSMQSNAAANSVNPSYPDMRPTQAASDAFGDPTMESGDWRAKLQVEARERIVNKILYTLKMHLPYSGDEGLQELKEIAVRFEKKIYAVATSQSDYLRKISLKMLTMHNRSQNASDPGSALPPGSALQQPTMTNVAGQSLNMQNVQNMSSLQQPTQQLTGQNVNLQNLQNMSTVQGMPQSNKMPDQQRSQQSLANVLPTQVQRSQPPLHQQVMSPMRSQVGQLQPNPLQMDMQQRLPPEASTTSLDSTAQTVNSNAGDWQEEVYQKLQALKDKYLPDLNNMQQKFLSKLQQLKSVPQQPKNKKLTEQLNIYNYLVEQFMQFLQTPKNRISDDYKDKVGNYEGKIITTINSSWRILGGPQQKPLQQSQQTHSQFTQVKSHENQNSLHGSIAPMQQNNMEHLQQRTGVSLSGGSNAQQNMMTFIQSSSNLDPGQNTSSVNPSLPLASTAQTGNPNGEDLQEEVYQKIKAMKDLYLQDLNNIQQKLLSKLQKLDSLPQQPTNEQLEMLKKFKNMFERMIRFLQIPKHEILASYKDNLGTYETQIIKVVNLHRQKRAAPRKKAQALPPQHMESLQQNAIDQQTAMPESSENSTAMTGDPNVGDWQEEVYQKMKAMEDLYLSDLIDIYQKFLSKLQQDSLPQQPKTEQLEKLKLFKNVLERYMKFLQTPKHEMLENYKDKVATYEKQIINVINSNRRKQDTYPQLPQIQSHKNQMDLQGSVTPMELDNMQVCSNVPPASQ